MPRPAVRNFGQEGRRRVWEFSSLVMGHLSNDFVA